MESFESLDNELEKNPLLDWGTVGEERHEYDRVVSELAEHICFEELEDNWDVFFFFVNAINSFV